MTRLGAWGGYNEFLRGYLDRIAEPGTTITIGGITKVGGIADQYRYLEHIEALEVMENVQTAMRQGYDAFLIGNIADPGIQACKEIAEFPVLGLCETCCHVACTMGANFAFVTLNDKFGSRVVENVRRYGLESRFAGARSMRVERMRSLADGYDNPVARAAIIDAFLVAANQLVDDGAEVVIAAGGVAMALLEMEGVHEVRKGVPILNGVAALVKMGEAAVRIAALSGGAYTSKRLNYAPPGADQIDEIRSFYGDVYPTVKK
jgi:allantoin racemase